jgi:hypothetical protein
MEVMAGVGVERACVARRQREEERLAAAAAAGGGEDAGGSGLDNVGGKKRGWI